MTGQRYNIAHILPWSGIGGVERATLRTAQALEALEFNNIMFCRSGAAAARDTFATAGFETAEYLSVQPSYRRPQAFLRNSIKLAREFSRRNIDIVHCSDLLAAHFTAVAGRMAGLPVLCHVRCSFAKIPRRDQTFLRAVNKFVFVSHDTWRHFGYPVSERRGMVLYDWMDPAVCRQDDKSAESVRREFSIPRESKIIGMIARIAPAKDYATLTRAAARVIDVDPAVRFLVVGSYSDEAANREHYKKVQQMLAQSEVSEHFIFTGFRTDVSRIIRALDIIVLSTHSEGLPLVVLEALAQAKPVIATAVGGIPEIVLDGKTGLLHEHENDRDLASKILSLIRDVERARRLGEAGLHLVRTRFGKEQFTTNLSNLYSRILQIKPDTRHSCSAANSVGAV